MYIGSFSPFIINLIKPPAPQVLSYNDNLGEDLDFVDLFPLWVTYLLQVHGFRNLGGQQEVNRKVPACYREVRDIACFILFNIVFSLT